VYIEKLFTKGEEGFVQYRQEPKGKPAFRNTEFFTTHNGLITHVDVYFGNEWDAPTSTEDEIRSVINTWTEAIRNKDIEGVLQHFAEHSVRFYLAPPLQDGQPLRKNLESWFTTFRGKIGYEIRDLTICTAADLAYCYAFNRLIGQKANGEADADVWFRNTLCLRRIEGRWLITHAHESVPFYKDGSFKAAVDLKPS
jgi:PhnB protein